jgi:hypothetical protein
VSKHVHEVTLNRRVAVSTQCIAVLLLSCASLVAAPIAHAQSSVDASLPRLRSWTLEDHELGSSSAPQSAHRLRVDMGIVTGTVWSPEVILDAAKGAAAILAQCGIKVSQVQLHEFDGPQRFRHLRTRDSREFAQRSGLQRPAVFFVDDTLQRPAFDAEAIGRANSKARPEMADTVWITAAIRDLPIALAHELVHVLTDAGEHSTARDNLMREDTAPGNTGLTPAQCASIVATGQAHGLLYAGNDPKGRR